jgi:hypothetical protein
MGDQYDDEGYDIDSLLSQIHMPEFDVASATQEEWARENAAPGNPTTAEKSNLAALSAFTDKKQITGADIPVDTYKALRARYKALPKGMEKKRGIVEEPVGVNYPGGMAGGPPLDSKIPTGDTYHYDKYQGFEDAGFGIMRDRGKTANALWMLFQAAHPGLMVNANNNKMRGEALDYQKKAGAAALAMRQQEDQNKAYWHVMDRVEKRRGDWDTKKLGMARILGDKKLSNERIAAGNRPKPLNDLERLEYEFVSKMKPEDQRAYFLRKHGGAGALGKPPITTAAALQQIQKLQDEDNKLTSWEEEIKAEASKQKSGWPSWAPWSSPAPGPIDLYKPGMRTDEKSAVMPELTAAPENFPDRLKSIAERRAIIAKDREKLQRYVDTGEWEEEAGPTAGGTSGLGGPTVPAPGGPGTTPPGAPTRTGPQPGAGYYPRSQGEDPMVLDFQDSMASEGQQGPTEQATLPQPGMGSPGPKVGGTGPQTLHGEAPGFQGESLMGPVPSAGGSRSQIPPAEELKNLDPLQQAFYMYLQENPDADDIEAAQWADWVTRANKVGGSRNMSEWMRSKLALPASTYTNKVPTRLDR